MKKECENIQKYIDGSENIYLVSHKNPDGDAMGSVFAMYYALKNMDKSVSILMTKHDSRYDFIEELSLAKEMVDENEIDLLICLDSSDIERLDILDADYKKAKKIIVIDHHIKKEFKADESIIDTSSPATCELLYNVFKCMDIEIDASIAKFIYLGILTDTGSFNYQRTTSKTHRIIAELLDTGIDAVYICKMVNDTFKEGKVKLTARLINKMESFYDGKVRYSELTMSDMTEFGINEQEAEGLTNTLRSIEKTEVAIYARQVEENTYKVSLRSSFYVDVAKIAMKYGGGGHIRAAGLTVKGNIEDFKNEILKEIGVNL